MPSRPILTPTPFPISPSSQPIPVSSKQSLPATVPATTPSRPPASPRASSTGGLSSRTPHLNSRTGPYATQYSSTFRSAARTNCRNARPHRHRQRHHLVKHRIDHLRRRRQITATELGCHPSCVRDSFIAQKFIHYPPISSAPSPHFHLVSVH